MRLSIRYASLVLGAVMIAVLGVGCGGHGGPAESTGSFAVTQPPEAGEAGVITGQLVSLREGEPVAEARITVDGAMAISDASGAFVVAGVRPGEHWLSVAGDIAILGGPILVKVDSGTNDLGRVVVDTVEAVPPSEPAI